MVHARTFSLILAAVGLLTLATCPAFGQGAVPGMQGAALDANPGVGYSRYNTPIPQQQYNANLYVTGQVSGLAGFRGDVPYRADNQFRGDLNSTSLSTFLAQSVGMDEVRRGRPYVSSPYFDPNLTIVSRQNYDVDRRPGAVSVPTEYLGRNTRRQLHAELNQGYETLLGLSEKAVALPRPLASGDGQQVAPHAAGQVTRLRPELSRPQPYAQGSLFGLSAAEDRYRLAREISQVNRPDEDDGQQDLINSIPAPKPIDLNQPVVDPENPLGTQDDREVERTPAGQDVFLDMMRQIKARRMGSARIDPQDSTEGSSEVASTGSDVIVQSLAGRGNDTVNYYMRGGQNQLRTGNFYEAANMFRNAARQDASNPLPKIGAGLALFAAGEPASAAGEIKDALQRFPAVMEARVASANLLPQGDLTRRMQGLEQKLKRDDMQKDPDMLLLATFMYQNTGQRTKARVVARQLKEVAEGNKLLEGYADYILTGKRVGGRGSRPPQSPSPAGQ